MLALQVQEVSRGLGKPQLEILAQEEHMKSMTLAAATVVAGFLLTVGAPKASADQFTFSLTSDHCSGTGGCLPDGGSAGTITVTDTGNNTVSVDVTLNSAYKFVNTGFDADFGFNLAGNPTITYTSISSGWQAVGDTTAPITQSAGTLHMDGTGDFEYGLICTACSTGGSNPQSGPLDFTITGTTASSFEQNALFQYFAVDLLGQGNTGAVDASTRSTPSVPDGGMTVMLLGGALVGLETLRRRVRA